MNIAIMIQSLFGGGAERTAQRLGDYYVNRGEHVYYFVGNYDLPQDYKVKGTVIRTDIDLRYHRSQKDVWLAGIEIFYQARKIRKLKKIYRIDVTISFMEGANYLNILSRYKDYVIVRVCTILSEFGTIPGALYTTKWLRRIYSRADKVISMSRDGIYELEHIYGIDSKKLVLIPNFLNTNDFKASNSKKSGCNIITMGRLEREKQQDRLLRSFLRVLEKKPEAHLTIIGKGRMETYLKGLCRRYGIEFNVTFQGFSEHPETYMECADVFVMTSLCEGFGNVVIEAMAMGVPVVLTDAPGGMRDIVGKYEENDGMHISSNQSDIGYKICRYGILSPRMPTYKPGLDERLEQEEVALGNAILEVLNDKDLRERLKKDAVKRAKVYDINSVIPLWNHVVYQTQS